MKSRTARPFIVRLLRPVSAPYWGRQRAEPVSGGCPAPEAGSPVADQPRRDAEPERHLPGTSRSPSGVIENKQLAPNTEARSLVAENLDDDTLAALSVPLTIEHPLPGAKVQLSLGDRHDHLVTHREAAQVGGGVVLPGLIVPVTLGIPRRDGVFEPVLDVVPQPRFVIVHEHRRGDMHGGHEDEPFRHPARADLLLDGVRDIDDLLPLLRVEPQIVGVALHACPRSPVRIVSVCRTRRIPIDCEKICPYPSGAASFSSWWRWPPPPLASP